MVGCAYLTSSSIKWSIGRARPVVEDLPHLMATPTGLSFPSSHSTSSFAAARAFTGLLPAGPLYCAATAMALSRLYLGVHYPVGRGGGRGARDAAGELRAMMKVGIVGMPNAGKSSLFNALSQAGARGGELPVHDDRAERRGGRRRGRAARRGGDDAWGASNVVPDTIEFHDIAGLVAGAHKGEGLGNQFLANIRETDALLHVVRAHDDPNVIHPDGRVDPAADMDTIETELIYADLEQAERRHARSCARRARATGARWPRRSGCWR